MRASHALRGGGSNYLARCLRPGHPTSQLAEGRSTTNPIVFTFNDEFPRFDPPLNGLCQYELRILNSKSLMKHVLIFSILM